MRSNVEPGTPTFGNILSGGDRTTLAFAFFLASLEGRPNLQNSIVVIDDPISSMDDHRASTTVRRVRELALRAAQVIVLSHRKPFLCRIWERAKSEDRIALEIARNANGSTFREWNVSEDSRTEHDRHYTTLRKYHDRNEGKNRDVAQSIRHYLEGYLRATCPDDLQPGESLGNNFIQKCTVAIGSKEEILSKTKLRELEDILEYAHGYHHSTTPGYETEMTVDSELLTFVSRTLEFTKP